MYTYVYIFLSKKGTYLIKINYEIFDYLATQNKFVATPNGVATLKNH